LFGGASGCERVIARFGNPDEFGYEEDFPVVALKIQPKLKKFSDELTHRDFLGSLMNLGIERKYLGDIIVKDNCAYVFIIEKFKDYIIENLSKVKHTVITIEVAQKIPEGELFITESISIPVSSLRLDCLLAGVYNLSRSQVTELFLAKKVFVNGRLIENISHLPKEKDVISLRGFGRFIFSSTGGTSKKGRIYVNLEKFV
jgi:RNA-binding protein YlmH